MEKVTNAGTVYKESKYYYWEPQSGNKLLCRTTILPQLINYQLEIDDRKLLRQLLQIKLAGTGIIISSHSVFGKVQQLCLTVIFFFFSCEVHGQSYRQG